MVIQSLGSSKVLAAGATTTRGLLPPAARLRGPGFRFSQPNSQPLPKGHPDMPLLLYRYDHRDSCLNLSSNPTKLSPGGYNWTNLRSSRRSSFRTGPILKRRTKPFMSCSRSSCPRDRSFFSKLSIAFWGGHTLPPRSSGANSAKRRGVLPPKHPQAALQHLLLELPRTRRISL